MSTTCRCSELIIYDFDQAFEAAIFSMKNFSSKKDSIPDRLTLLTHKFWRELIGDGYISSTGVEYIVNSVYFQDDTLEQSLQEMCKFLRNILEDFMSMDPSEPYTRDFVYEGVKFVEDDYIHYCTTVDVEEDEVEMEDDVEDIEDDVSSE